MQTALNQSLAGGWSASGEAPGPDREGKPQKGADRRSVLSPVRDRLSGGLLALYQQVVLTLGALFPLLV